MIVKHLSVKTKAGMGRLLNYLANAPDRLRDKEGKSFVVRNHLLGSNPEEWEREFLLNEEKRMTERSDSVYAHHVVLSFHADDAPHITQEVLQDFAEQYISFAAEDALVLAVPHHDRDHLHVHLAISGIDRYEGKSTRMSQGEFAELKQKLQDYQCEWYPELSNSLVEHGRSKRVDKSRDQEAEHKPRTKKESLIEQIQELLNISSSREDFLASLEKEGINTYGRSGTLTGIEVDGKKYRFKRTLGLDLDTWDFSRSQDKPAERESKAESQKETADSSSTNHSNERERDVIPSERLPSNEKASPSKEDRTNQEDNKQKESSTKNSPNTQLSQRTSELRSIRQNRDSGRSLDNRDSLRPN